MTRSSQILKEITQLILSVENSSIQKIEKLKMIKVLFAIKLKLVELLEKELEIEAKMIYQAGLNAKRIYTPLSQVSENNTENRAITNLNKQEIIIEFIKNNKGRVSVDELLSLGIAGRSLRRYLKNLIDGRKIKIERSGRNYFYLLAS